MEQSSVSMEELHQEEISAQEITETVEELDPVEAEGRTEVARNDGPQEEEEEEVVSSDSASQRSSVEYSARQIERQLGERGALGSPPPTDLAAGGAPHLPPPPPPLAPPQPRSAVCIYKLPQYLTGILKFCEQPQTVSIGPYHRGKRFLVKFEEEKWQFLQELLARTSASGRNLNFLVEELKRLEGRTRACYSEILPVSSHDFVEMMLLDGSFIIGFFRCVSDLAGNNRDLGRNPYFSSPRLIPEIMADLLKLENQLPMFLLQHLFEWSWRPGDRFRSNEFSRLALQVFDQSFAKPEGISLLRRTRPIYSGKHLLDLIHMNLLPSDVINHVHHGLNDQQISMVPVIPGALTLRSSGITTKPRRNPKNFFDIKFRRGVLEIPSILFDNFTANLFFNSLAWEHRFNRSKYMNDYLFFMRCLVRQPSDVSALSFDGIISRFGQNESSICYLISNLGMQATRGFHHCYLSKELKEVNAYMKGCWARMMRSYFFTECSSIAVLAFSIIIILLLLLIIISVLNYIHQHSA